MDSQADGVQICRDGPSLGWAPDFAAFSRWLAGQTSIAATAHTPSEALLTTAGQARDEFLRAVQSALPMHLVPVAVDATTEVLELLAAASTEPSSQPPELLTPRGFSV